MQRPLEITFRDMSPSSSVQGAIEHWVARLERRFGRIHSCAVVIGQPHHSHRRGNQFSVHIELTVPGRTVSVSREPAHGSEHENAYVAISDAFRAARRQLSDHAETQRDRETANTFVASH